MKFEKILSLIEGIPYTSPRAGKVLYDFILESRPVECLELGFAHGVSSCYVAAALDELGQGHLTSVDLASSADRTPPIEDLLEKADLTSRVTVCREKNSYTWFLQKKIEERSGSGNCEPCYDFAFIDGPKNWTIDGCAFFLVNKLLREGGWVLFDDYKWAYGTSREATDGITHRELSIDQINAPNIELVFKYLVMQHPDYSEFKLQDEEWAWARKVRNSERVFEVETRFSLKFKLHQMLRRLFKKSSNRPPECLEEPAG